MSFIRLFLLPFTLLYFLITWVRNKLFDWGVLPSRSFDIPIIGIGNLSLGGSGKTPLVEFLVSILGSERCVAVLSRGYKRKKRGFLIANQDTPARDIGDEAKQVSRKFPEITVAVCNNRVKGIKRINTFSPNSDVVILDDSFQHRYIKPGLNLVVTQYHRPFWESYLAPYGYLREGRSGAKRADAIVVSNTPGVFSPLERDLALKSIRKYFCGKVFFSTVIYDDWVPLTNVEGKHYKKPKTIFLLTGIASTISLENHLRDFCRDLVVKKFPDHYSFKKKDLLDLKQAFLDCFGASKAIVTTEKDAMRLIETELVEVVKGLPVYYIPIRVKFHQPDNVLFEKLVFDYVKKFGV